MDGTYHQVTPAALPHPGSPEASAMIDSVLAEYGWPANPKNAARAGYEAARRIAALALRGYAQGATVQPLYASPVPASPPDLQGAATGWPPGMLQDDSRELSRALASKPDAMRHAREAAATIDELRNMEARKDAAYLERSQVVAALAKCFPSGVARTAIEGWSDDWHGCVYIDLPTGQVSWHFHDSHAYLFTGLPAYTKTWDGHDTPEKYRRLAALAVIGQSHAGDSWWLRP